jgi:hypothetical protein
VALPGKKTDARSSQAKPFSVAVESDNAEHPILKFSGSINESVPWEKVKIPAAQVIEMDLGGIEVINSAGGRGWVNWVYSINRGVGLSLVNCSRVFIDYVNTIHGFVPTNGKITSFQVPYFCAQCGATPVTVLQSEKVRRKIQDIPNTMTCSCGEMATMDVMTPAFFKFLEKF